MQIIPPDERVISLDEYAQRERKILSYSDFVEKKDEILHVLRNPNGFTQHFNGWINHRDPNCLCALGLIQVAVLGAPRVLVKEGLEDLRWRLICLVIPGETEHPRPGLGGNILRWNDTLNCSYAEIAGRIQYFLEGDAQ